MLIIVCGLQGTGKTTIGKKIAEKTGAILLRTDAIRKELIEYPTYSEDEKSRVYEEMFSQAKELLKTKTTVILDATFAEKQNRQLAKKIAEKTGHGFKIIEVKCSSEKIIKTRLRKRFKDESDARYGQYLKYKKIFNPIVEKHIIIDNSGELEKTDKQIDHLFKP